MKPNNRLAILLESCLPDLAPGQGTEFCLTVYALIIGIQQMANPAPVVKEIISREKKIAAFNINFMHTFELAVQHLLFGMAYKNRHS